MATIFSQYRTASISHSSPFDYLYIIAEQPSKRSKQTEMPLPFLTKTKTLKASQPTPTQGPNPTLITSETCQSLKTVQKTKRYEFARGFTPDAITILDSDTRHAVYHLSGSDFGDPVRGPSGRSKASCIRLRNARTQGVLATIRPRRLFRDVVTLHSTTASRVASKKFRMSCVGRTGLLGVLR